MSAPIEAKTEVEKILDELKLATRSGSWTQSNGEQSWEMPKSTIYIKGKKQATAKILALLDGAVLEKLESIYREPQMHGDWQRVIEEHISDLKGKAYR